MDKRDIGIALLTATFITTLIKGLYLLSVEGATLIEAYIGVGSDPILFLTNLILYLLGAYIVVGGADKSTRDLWVNLLFFLIPSSILIFTILFIVVTAGPASLTLLVETAQFPIYHVLLTILTGIIVIVAGATPNRNILLYGLSFTALIVVYGIIRVFVGIVAPIAFGFLILAIVMAFYLTKKVF